jgi:serine/threonine protein kinase
MTFDAAKARSIFVSAVEEHEPAEWNEFLDGACREDDALRRRVESLLRAHQGDDAFLDRGDAIGTVSIGDRRIAEGPGTEIGPYKLLQQIGEGGMGVVFMAEQADPIRRSVALKIIKPGMDTRQVIARFEAERQALAMMDHPNIARVLDAGTTETGRPYFVMELVKGVPITRYCDDHHLTICQRLELFLPICHAVQHAHQKGIIHRDLKPTNVLVAEYDNRAIPKVIDFGVAKATAQRLTERTMFTEFGQLVGTFEYMSPEQAKFNQLDVDTRSDIYSLGVLLYELLVGSTPLERQRIETEAFDETLRIIREEDPPKPSTRFSSLPFRVQPKSDAVPFAGKGVEGDSNDSATIAANRHTEPAKLNKELHGELDWIVMKALEKDRNRRYEAASALAADISHYLADEPVSAAAPTRLYRASKFVRRNKGTVIATAAVLAGLVAGIIGTTIGLVSQSQQRAIAERERAEAQVNLAAALQSQDNFAEAEKLYRQALASGSSNTLEDRQRAARTLLRLAATVRQRGNAHESERLYREAIEAHRAAFPPRDPGTAQALQDFGIFVRDQGRWSEAEPLFREAYEIRRHANPPDHRATGFAAVYLGHINVLHNRYAEAEPLFREAIAEYQLASPPDAWATGLAHVELGRALNGLGRRTEAEAEFLAGVRELEFNNEGPMAKSALAAFYTDWDQSEPGKGYDAKAKEWFIKSIKIWIRPPLDGSAKQQPEDVRQTQK